VLSKCSSVMKLVALDAALNPLMSRLSGIEMSRFSLSDKVGRPGRRP
jgi:hypothetical protein